MNLPIVLTMGEPAGVGGEIAFKAWLLRREISAPFFLIDDPARLTALAARVGLDVPVVAIDAPEQAAAIFAKALPVLPLPLPGPSEPGRLNPVNAGAVVESIDRAVALVRARRAGAVVTNPIHKYALREAGFRYPGHTEYLAHLAGPEFTPVMMLAGRGLRVVPVTIHMALTAAIAALDTAGIVACGRATAMALTSDFGIEAPRLAVAALNPHGGEGGIMGREEIDIIAPAVVILRREGITALGPAPADTLFHEGARAGYDAVLCMYHDQALIPLKTVDFAGGVNVTLGLPFVRTSPDHGTALDIAGTGRADATSLIAALTLAAEMAARRASHPDGG
ncbi:MAG: 4-hydroxythreonine-4-phosphate dehydrogenase PdxA [Alphaproteobacteria bacterium]|nr:4-hydroxythreonine-4-phosphate dehydrogenase PdxA [Alphaproteobacteria bacterium]